MKKVLLITAAMLLPVILVIGCSASRAGYETARYSVLSEAGEFEMRDYPPMMVATTPMKAANPNEDDGSFMRLFRYISKDNESETKIAMTTPVFLSDDDKGRRMSFVLPEKLAQDGAPVPKSERVALETVEGGRYAVYRYRGSWKPEATEAARKKLEKWAAAEGLTLAGDPEVAHYDPPFTPPFLRRNEVRVRVKAD